MPRKDEGLNKPTSVMTTRKMMNEGEEIMIRKMAVVDWSRVYVSCVMAAATPELKSEKYVF